MSAHTARRLSVLLSAARRAFDAGDYETARRLDEEALALMLVDSAIR